MTVVFASMEVVRPLEIVIDKDKTSLNSINTLVESDDHCWCIKNGENIQMCNRVLFCHLNVMKTQSENLLIHIHLPYKN